MENDSWWTPQRLKCRRLLEQLFTNESEMSIHRISEELEKYHISRAVFHQVAKKMNMRSRQTIFYVRPSNFMLTKHCQVLHADV